MVPSELGDLYFISASRVNLGLHQRDEWAELDSLPNRAEVSDADEIAGAAVFLFGTRGLYPLLPIFRRLGVRTAREIERERYAVTLELVTVTEERKLKYDFVTYRLDNLAWLAKKGSGLTVTEPAEVVTPALTA